MRVEIVVDTDDVAYALPAPLPQRAPHFPQATFLTQIAVSYLFPHLPMPCEADARAYQPHAAAPRLPALNRSI